MTTTPASTAAATAAAARAALDAAGLSVNRAAQLTGIPQSTLDRRLLGGTPGFTVSELSALASVLGVDASSLVRQGAAA